MTRADNVRRFNSLILSMLLISISVTTALFVQSEAANKRVPAYLGEETIVLNGNVPDFAAEEITTSSFEKYGSLDEYGRCTASIACIGTDIMPVEERGSIAAIKPTGWNQNKYPGIVDSDPPYLYNRCHVIGFQLTGENDNEKNLITGTRYMNVEGMLPYENIVAEYVVSTGNHVMYRVTPVFDGINLLCTGVQMEAYSVEDSGKGISFNVFCYNVQPGVYIDYSDGSNWLDDGFIFTGSDTLSEQTTRSAITGDGAAVNSSENDLTEEADYIANKNSKKFHYPSCESVSDMKEKNKLYFQGTRDELIEQGYEPCKRCNP